MKRKAATPANAVTKNGVCEQKRSVASRNDKTAALISAKSAEIRQIELFVVRLAEAVPAESVRLERKSTFYKIMRSVCNGRKYSF
ncbi:hypothetical protein QTL97_16075 [Sporosarcina thermotolerans]|uniref:Uncharacterized protein n=1 Tax=Sporosarcina thermotolerans TaxID=633404 RepID=A0AAW9ACX8_9BACL|nr:hypothetical protein [Sporosarcina thermotolerans]MDW0118448.1 hypothetical protein [Sporosarcina thermotolerans]WHT47709.1 hypothetical protein QNH10_16520 [Sporosarcina thermotolerans]